MQITEKSLPGYERVLFGEDTTVGYRGIIVVHSTARGPGGGGTRFWNYRNDAEALEDALRLAHGMTYKNALAELPLGGGKSVIIGDNKITEREAIFRAHGRFVNALSGQYMTAEDVGTSPADMAYVLKETAYVAGLHGRSGDPSPKTARGVLRAMQAAAQHRWQSQDLSKKTVAIQGCGHVGYFLAQELHHVGARLMVTDIDRESAQHVVSEFGATAVAPEQIYSVRADIFAPCALGGIMNDQTIPQLEVEIVCGAANNQLLEPRHGGLLEQRGISYAPDYAANAGGIINGCCIELQGWDPAATLKKVDAIYDTILQIFQLAEKEHIPSYQAADKLAEQRVKRP
ncbi:MAG TPA: Glu/Leu/Phe/Val dehydrogenase [Candidatus Angelobacter sp.]